MRYFCLVLLLFGFVSLQAQEEADSVDQYRPWSVFVSSGFSHPSLDYWNEDRLPEVGTDERFSWHLRPAVYLDYYLIKNFRARFGVSYWSGKINTPDAEQFKSVKVSMSTVTLGALYGFELLNLDFYTGVKGNFSLIQNKFTFYKGTGNLEDQAQGQDYWGDLVIGFDKLLPFNLQLGVEANYCIGNYYQAEDTNLGRPRQKVLMHGPYFGINLGYRFSYPVKANEE